MRARARRCRLHVPRCLPRARRVGFGRVGRDLKASSARGRFPASPVGHRPDSQAVKTELYVWGCYLKKIPTFLSDDPSLFLFPSGSWGSSTKRASVASPHLLEVNIWGTSEGVILEPQAPRPAKWAQQ